MQERRRSPPPLFADAGAPQEPAFGSETKVQYCAVRVQSTELHPKHNPNVLGPSLLVLVHGGAMAIGVGGAVCLVRGVRSGALRALCVVHVLCGSVSALVR